MRSHKLSVWNGHVSQIGLYSRVVTYFFLYRWVALRTITPSCQRTRRDTESSEQKSIPVHLTELFKLLFYLNGQSIQVIKHDVIGLREQSWITLLENKNIFPLAWTHFHWQHLFWTLQCNYADETLLSKAYCVDCAIRI